MKTNLEVVKFIYDLGSLNLGNNLANERIYKAIGEAKGFPAFWEELLSLPCFDKEADTNFIITIKCKLRNGHKLETDFNLIDFMENLDKYNSKDE